MDTFDERPLCAVDSLVFSWLSYAPIGPELSRAWTVRGIALHELLRAEDFEGMFGSSWDELGSRDLLFAVCASPRFRTCRLCDLRCRTDKVSEEQFAAMTFRQPDGTSYIADLLFAVCASPRFRTCRLCDLRCRTDKVSEEQFAAMTFRQPDGTSYIAFRGTDSTVVGWKEDFNMTYLSPVPAQEEAAAYMDEVAARTPGELYVGGHSKGGNLAVYAAAMCMPQYVCPTAHPTSRFAVRIPPSWVGRKIST